MIVLIYVALMGNSCFENSCNRTDLALPLLGFGGECSAALRGQEIVFRAAILLSRSPLGLHIACAFHSAERGKQGTSIDFKDATTNLLNPYTDPIAVHW